MGELLFDVILSRRLARQTDSVERVFDADNSFAHVIIV